MCKELPLIPVNKVMDPKKIIGKNGGPRRRSGTYFFKFLNIFL
jgi:hypothetical protein